MNNNNNELILKPINQLLDEKFFIPAYQRGYRWTKRQVTELLNDIKEFQIKGKQGQFYCLQPIVVKKHEDEWELVDGQQRLTTIFIIMTYLLDIMNLLGKSRYQLRYQTRSNSANFLENIDLSLREENIDFFHICEAFDAIKEWFESQDSAYKLQFLQILLGASELDKDVKVIWYQVNEDIDATAVFTRLNVGKIPLTNAELVKALFLKSENFDEPSKDLKQLKIAHEWDVIERELQNDDFWFFINNENVEANRIEFILDLLVDELEVPETLGRKDPYYIFLSFNSHFSATENPLEDEWGRVKNLFMILKEWYEDRVLFHIVGYLIAQNVTVTELLIIRSNTSTKKELVRKFVSVCFTRGLRLQLSLENYQDKNSLREDLYDHISELSYEFDSHKPRLISMLLCFNIASLILNAKSNTRFQFDQFKLESWDLEHIRSVASQMPESKDRQRMWIESVIDYLNEVLEQNGSSDVFSQTARVIRDSAVELVQAQNFDSERFGELFTEIIDTFSPDADEDVDNSIGNLTLLDSSTNRSYKNAIFPIKRRRLIALDKTATFVPICTKNVFLKYYSKQVDNMLFWRSSDSENYMDAITEMLTEFYYSEGIA